MSHRRARCRCESRRTADQAQATSTALLLDSYRKLQRSPLEQEVKVKSKSMSRHPQFILRSTTLAKKNLKTSGKELSQWRSYHRWTDEEWKEWYLEEE